MVARCVEHKDRRAVICFGLALHFTVLTEGEKKVVIYAPEGTAMGFCPGKVIAHVKRRFPAALDERDPKGRLSYLVLNLPVTLPRGPRRSQEIVDTVV